MQKSDAVGIFTKGDDKWAYHAPLCMLASMFIHIEVDLRDGLNLMPKIHTRDFYPLYILASVADTIKSYPYSGSERLKLMGDMINDLM